MRPSQCRPSAGVRELEAPPKYKREALIIGVWRRTPSGIQGQSPWSGGHLKLKHFWLLDVY